jgi:hypothetical protein
MRGGGRQEKFVLETTSDRVSSATGRNPFEGTGGAAKAPGPASGGRAPLPHAKSAAEVRQK